MSTTVNHTEAARGFVVPPSRCSLSFMGFSTQKALCQMAGLSGERKRTWAGKRGV